MRGRGCGAAGTSADSGRSACRSDVTIDSAQPAVTDQAVDELFCPVPRPGKPASHLSLGRHHRGADAAAIRPARAWRGGGSANPNPVSCFARPFRGLYGSCKQSPDWVPAWPMSGYPAVKNSVSAGARCSADTPCQVPGRKRAEGRCCVRRFLSSVGALSGCSGQIASASSSKIARSLQRSKTSVTMS